MLETLHIRGYALIEEIEVDFRNGFNVLTGETGAGKSIIVGALMLALGARASSNVLRDGAKRAQIDALFRLPRPAPRLVRLLKGHDITLENDELILSRTVTADGRSRGYVAGNLVPISVLSEVGDELVDLHGQHEHQSLLKPDRQLELLDAFAGVNDDATAVAEAVSQLHDLDKAIAELTSDDRTRTRQLEFLRFELNEIDAANLHSEEEEELKTCRTRITNAEQIVAAASRAYTTLYEGEGTAAVDRIGDALRALEELAAIVPQVGALAEQLHGARATVEEVAAEVRPYTEHTAFDPGELDVINQRLVLISDLKRKYGDSIQAILAYRNQAREQIESLEQRDERLGDLQRDWQREHAQAMRDAQTLSKKRQAAARKLDRRVAATLHELGMKRGRFETRFEPADLSRKGIDRVEFYLAANPGERLKRLRQVASGGEIARIMLALKVVFAHADTIPTLIFDEIDAGVGGAMAGKVADRLRELAASHQTICITHLPQIAAAAQTHYHVGKMTRKGRTVATVAAIEDDSRIEEVARLLDGSVSPVSLQHARELLQTQ